MTTNRVKILKLSTWWAAAGLSAWLPCDARGAGFTSSAPLYRAKEASFDMFGSYLAAENGINHLFSTNIRGGAWGGGIGVNYFPTVNMGFGTDVNIPNNGGQFIDSYTINIIYRIPLESVGLAPYLTGGGGRGYDPSLQWIAQAGVGLEYRTSHKAGIFVDGRYEWGQHSGTDQLELRAGLRFVF
jgi:hypothetical protein